MEISLLTIYLKVKYKITISPAYIFLTSYIAQFKNESLYYKTFYVLIRYIDPHFLIYFLHFRAMKNARNFFIFSKSLFSHFEIKEKWAFLTVKTSLIWIKIDFINFAFFFKSKYSLTKFYFFSRKIFHLSIFYLARSIVYISFSFN